MIRTSTIDVYPGAKICESNSIIRQFKNNESMFLRIQFADENLK